MIRTVCFWAPLLIVVGCRSPSFKEPVGIGPPEPAHYFDLLGEWQLTGPVQGDANPFIITITEVDANAGRYHIQSPAKIGDGDGDFYLRSGPGHLAYVSIFNPKLDQECPYVVCAIKSFKDSITVWSLHELRLLKAIEAGTISGKVEQFKDDHTIYVSEPTESMTNFLAHGNLSDYIDWENPAIFTKVVE